MLPVSDVVPHMLQRGNSMEGAGMLCAKDVHLKGPDSRQSKISLHLLLLVIFNIPSMACTVARVASKSSRRWAASLGQESAQ